MFTRFCIVLLVFGFVATETCRKDGELCEKDIECCNESCSPEGVDQLPYCRWHPCSIEGQGKCKESFFCHQEYLVCVEDDCIEAGGNCTLNSNCCSNKCEKTHKCAKCKGNRLGCNSPEECCTQKCLRDHKGRRVCGGK